MRDFQILAKIPIGRDMRSMPKATKVTASWEAGQSGEANERDETTLGLLPSATYS